MRVSLAATVLLVVPLLVTACSNPATPNRSTETPVAEVELELPALELQVDYLINEIRELEQQKGVIDSLVVAAGPSVAGRAQAARRSERDILQWRVMLLREMLGERLRAREEARMQAAVSLTTQG